MAGPVLAEACHTIASGNWNDSTVWDCGCDPSACDTLIVSHAMVATLPDTEINATFLRIEPAGSITSNGQLSVFGTLHNYGSIDVVRMWCFYSGTFRNYSNIVADVFINVKDTCFNFGSIQANDSIVNGWGRNMHNWSGVLQGNVILNLGMIHNLGATCSLMGAEYNGRLQSNEGSISIVGRVELSLLVQNSGSITAGSLHVLNGFENDGIIICTDSLINGVPEFQAISNNHINAIVETQNFLNHQSCEIRDQGTICISGTSINNGTLGNFAHICDTSPTTTEWPYLDVNTGIVESSVIICQLGLCSVGIGEYSNLAQLTVYPNPSSDAVVMELGSAAVKSIELVDGSGRIIRTMQGPFREQVTMQRMGLEAGCYIVMAYDAQGSLLGRSQVIFVDP